MYDYNPGGSGDLDAVKSDGTPTLRTAPPINQNITLANATTYFIPIGSDQSMTPAMAQLVSIHLKWIAAFAATITVESCNFPRERNAQPSVPNIPNVTDTQVDVSDFDATAGNWIAEAPSSGSWSVVGTGNSATGLTLTAGGTNAGGAMLHLGNMGSRRIRLKIVVTTGGTDCIRANRRGKNAA